MEKTCIITTNATMNVPGIFKYFLGRCQGSLTIRKTLLLCLTVILKLLLHFFCIFLFFLILFGMMLEYLTE